MKIRLPFFLFAMLLSLGIQAQTTILDFESEATSTTFQYFGSTLEGSLSTIIANPDLSGLNTSANVGEFIKPADSQVWAGGFSNPNPSTPVDVVAGNDVCLKVWMPATGNVALKLEGGTTSNWIQTQSVDAANMWVEVCFDTNLASEEDPFTPAAGGVFNTVTLFFDFGTSFTEDMTYYFDDLIVGAGDAGPADITFSVDMNNYEGDFSTVFISGTFNEWSGNSNPLNDDDNDGVWTATYPLDPGSYEYKFQLDEWDVQEEFGGKSYPCTVTNDGFTNRNLNVGPSASLPTYCWNSCYACGESVDITVNLGTSGIDVSPDGVFIAGGGNFGNPGDYPLLDGDGDGVYSMTFEREAGFASFYTFTNGACPDYSCKEDIAGQDCADPDNFNDRYMGPFTEDATISTCFSECTENTECSSSGPKMVTFGVDMTPYTGSYTTVNVNGTFNTWCGDCNPLTDEDGDGIFTVTLPLPEGDIEYKFTVDGWNDQEIFNEGDPCTVTNDGFTNRFLTISEDVSVCYVWNTCDECVIAADPVVTFSVDMTNYEGDFTTAYVAGNFVDWSGDAIPMSDDDGDNVWTATYSLAPGMYEYKFELDNWAVSEQFEDGDPCTITDESGQFVNRALEVGSEDMEVCFQWETCENCILFGVSSIEAADNLFTLAPSLVQTYTTVLLNDAYGGEKELILFNTLGEIVMVQTIRNGVSAYTISAEDLQNGLYYLNVQTDRVQQTQKFIVNR